MRRARQLAAAILLAVPGALASAASAPDIPTPYVPSTDLNVDEMLRLAEVRPGDVVYDLGSGDGRIVIAAARDWGAARGVGVELDPKLVETSRERATSEGVADRVSFQQGDVLKAPIADATVVTMYLLTPLVERLKPRLMKELKPGTRIVAHEYGFSDWKPDRHVQVSKNFYLYVVPVQIGGKWKLETALPSGAREYDFELAQRYQEVKGGARVAGGWLPAFEPRVSGDRVAFVLIDDNVAYRFEGRASTLEMKGVVRWGTGAKQQQGTWRAVRAATVSEG